MGLYLKHNQTNFQVGDTIKVRQQITEGNKKRSQTFEGLVIRIKGHQGEKTFTVRKISGGIGVEKIWPIDCPSLQKITISKKGKVRRAVLSYLRERVGRQALKVKTDYTYNSSNDDSKKTSTTKKPKPKTEAGKSGGVARPKTSSK
jgi:large subunit ribosomal protein L19